MFIVTEYAALSGGAYLIRFCRYANSIIENRKQ